MQMAKFLREFGSPLTHLISFLLGTLAGFFIYTFITNSWQLKITPDMGFQIDPTGIISLIISVILAVYVLRKLSKKDEGEKVERNLLINYFTTFQTELEARLKNIAKGGSKFDFVNALLKRYGMRMEELFRLAIEHGFLKEGSDVQALFYDKFKKLRELLTNTPKTGAIEDGIRLENGELHFSDSQTDKISVTNSEINSTIFKIVVEINRSSRS
jgi:hypothetical protein